MTMTSATQSYFDFLVPVTKELLRIDEVMTILRKEKDSIYELIAEGKLEAHQEEGRCSHYRITRRSVITHLAATALYGPQDLSDTLFLLVQRLPLDQRRKFIARLNSLS